MKIEFIKSPSPGALAILARRSTTDSAPGQAGAVGLVQGALAEMIAAADIAEKAASVRVEEIRGVCPQHVTLIAIYGDIAAVEHSLKVISEKFKGRPLWQDSTVTGSGVIK